MKIIFYECKKILNVKLLAFLLVFTGLFYNMFMGVTIHPNDNASCIAENEFAYILKNEYGFDTVLPYENFAVVEEIRQKQIQELNVLVEKSTILKESGITNYQQLAAMDLEKIEDDVMQELTRIQFEDGIRQVFLEQHISSLYESMEFHPTMGIASGKELEAAKTFLNHTTLDGYTDAAARRVAAVITENRLSLLPAGVMFHLADDFPRYGVLLIISCLLLVLPYQIKERLAGVNPLFATTTTGRALGKKRCLSAMISCIFVCVLQFLIFCVVLGKVGVLQYWNYPASGNGNDFYWMDMTMGTYLTLNVILYTFIAIGAMMIFYLISRMSANYIVGTAIGIPTAVVLGILTINLTSAFMYVTYSISYDILRPLGYVLILLLIAIVIISTLMYREQRRDIFI